MLQTPKSKILILDDDLDVLHALERIVRSHFEVFTATDIAAAREVLSRESVALAMIDLHLSSGTSLDFFKELKTHWPSTVRVLVSGDPDLGPLLQSLDSSLIHKVIRKPWEPSLLLLPLKEAEQLHFILQKALSLEQQSTTDAMTGLFNFRYLQEQLSREVERAKRLARPLSFIMMDLDNFKTWNDKNGHQAGDELLRDLSKILRAGLRTFDCVCRYGGDEFCVILQETDLDHAREISERIRTQFLKKSGQTLSLGVSSYPNPSSSLEKILADSDRALYEAKGQGRNRTVTANPLVQN